MGELIAILFLCRTLAHQAHFKVSGPGSHAAHLALGAFYDEIVDKADAIAEAWQGRTGKLLDIPCIDCDDKPEAIQITLRKHMEWIDKNRYKVCPREYSSIHNRIDEAVSCFEDVLYKLRFLK